MKYQLGDTVLVLHSNEEGEVVEIINDKMVVIDVAGIRFPVYMDQIDFPYFKRFSEKRSADKAIKNKVHIDDIKKDKSTTKVKIGDGMWLSFLPLFNKDVFDDDVVEAFKIFLINQTNEPYDFKYQINFAGSPGFELKNQVLSLSDFYIHDIPFEQMNDSPRFSFEFSLVNPDKKKAPYFETTLKIKAKQLFQRIEEMRLKNEPTFTFKLFDEYPDKIEEVLPEYNSSQVFYDVSAVKQQLEPARSVIDLHIEKLTTNWQRLSNFEILTLQLNTFEKYYQLSLAHHQPNLIVVHGIGKGKLREEIHEILKYKKEVKSFVNQYHHNFGFGATEIFFQY